MWQVRAPDRDGSPYRVEVSVNGTSLIMELDTGASVSVVSEETFRRTFPSCRLEPSSVMLKGYTGELSPVQGSLPATVRLGNHECRDVLYVVPGRCPSLMGRGWMKGLGIELRNVMDVQAITSSRRLSMMVELEPRRPQDPETTSTHGIFVQGQPGCQQE
ncbi:hypothetical protein MTO96_033892 [Rhipicephalus appendiculatus]